MALKTIDESELRNYVLKKYEEPLHRLNELLASENHLDALMMLSRVLIENIVRAAEDSKSKQSEGWQRGQMFHPL